MQLLRGGYLYEELRPADMRPSALPEELIRCYEEKSTDKDGREQVKKISLMYRREVPQFRTLFLSGALNLYSNWRLFNKEPPSGKGWAQERNITARILQTLESENNLYDAWEHEKEDLRRRHKKP